MKNVLTKELDLETLANVNGGHYKNGDEWVKAFQFQCTIENEEIARLAREIHVNFLLDDNVHTFYEYLDALRIRGIISLAEYAAARN